MSIVDVADLRLVSIEPRDTVRDAIRRMLDDNVGSVAVCEGPRLARVALVHAAGLMLVRRRDKLASV